MEGTKVERSSYEMLFMQIIRLGAVRVFGDCDYKSPTGIVALLPVDALL